MPQSFQRPIRNCVGAVVVTCMGSVTAVACGAEDSAPSNPPAPSGITGGAGGIGGSLPTSTGGVSGAQGGAPVDSGGGGSAGAQGPGGASGGAPLTGGASGGAPISGGASGGSQMSGGGDSGGAAGGGGPIALSVACDPSAAGKPELVQLLSLSGSPTAGSEASLNGCSFCHGFESQGKTDGTTTIYPPLRDLAWTCEQVEVLVNGKEGTAMEGFAADNDEQWLADMIAYVSTLKGSLPPIVVEE